MNLVTGLRMGIYEDQQIHTKTGLDQSDFNTACPASILTEYRQYPLASNELMIMKLLVVPRA